MNEMLAFHIPNERAVDAVRFWDFEDETVGIFAGAVWMMIILLFTLLVCLDGRALLRLAFGTVSFRDLCANRNG